MQHQNKIKPVEVFSGTLGQATLMQNLLKEHNIPAYLNSELMATIAPWQIEAGGFNPVKVMVSNLDYDVALKLIEGFNVSESHEEPSE